MPVTWLDRLFYALKSHPLAIDRAVNGHVVLEGIRASNVVIIFVLAAPNDATRFVLLSRDWLELHRNKSVFDASVSFNANRERGYARLLKHVWLARRIVSLLDGPFCRPASRLCAEPIGLELTGSYIVKVYRVGRCRCGDNEKDKSGSIHRCLSRGLVQSVLDSGREFHGRTTTPVVEKDVARLF
jgi:hypothetical protein